MKKITVLLLFLFTAQAHAVSGNVTNIYQWKNALAVWLDVPFSNPAGCSSTYAYMLDDSEPNLDVAFAKAQLLTASVNGNRVSISLHPSECYNGKPKITALGIKP